MRQVLALVTFGLFAAVVADRVAKTVHTTEASAGAGIGTPATGLTTVDPTSRPSAGRSATLPAVAGSTVDRLARLATRQKLRDMADVTYLDSLIAITDSTVRRWPDRPGQPLRVFITEGGAPGYHPRMATFLREALDRWEAAYVGVTFTTVADSAAADITVRWIDRFTIERAGQTDVTWDQNGYVRRAAISLAIRTNGGFVIPDPLLLAIAVHEVGHAIGLPHSADSNDVMYPSARSSMLSHRDRKTATLLYRLPPGSVRDGAPLEQ